MLKSTLTFLLIFAYSIGYSQFEDNFDQGSIASSWLGQRADFIINGNGELQLNSEEAATSNLYHPVNFPDSLTWNFDVRMPFSPSSNNNLRVYLAVDNPDLSVANGYVLNIGESGSDDAIHLVQLIGGIETIIASGTPGLVASSFDLNINLSKNRIDEWSLTVTDYKDNNILQEFDVIFNDDIIEDQMYFGFECKYTASNSDKFNFDNIAIQQITSDLEAPELTKVNLLNNNTIQLIFNEAVTQASAENFDNYTFEPSNQLSAIVFEETTDNEIILQLNNSLSSCTDFILTINGIQDLFGNTIDDIRQTLTIFEEAEVGDVLINELLSNPIETGTDFVELINVSSKSIQLENLIIRNDDRDDETIIEGTIEMLPNEIIVISESLENLISLYEVPFPNQHIENNLPGFNNTNGNVSIIINSQSGLKIIDSYNYDNDQLNSNLESEDGVSFERISCLANTNDFENWSSATAEVNFATPGYQNSISVEDQNDFVVNIVNENELEIRFKDAIAINDISNLSNYSINGITLSDLLIDDDNPKVAILFLENPLLSGQEYNINISNLNTICGEGLAEQDVAFRLIENAEVGDLLINEILFNPYKDQFDFVEIINNSNKFIRIDDLNIFNSFSENNTDINSSIILEPNQIIAFTSSPETLIDQYDPPSTANIITQSLPAFNDDSGNITLRQEALIGFVDLDAFDYQDDFHFELIRDSEGVSLERISLITETNEPTNWFSSSEGNNFATPGYENSTRIDPTSTEDLVSLAYKTFSPNGDSDKDILFINYKMEKLGFVGNIKIYDDKGRPKKTLVNNASLGSEGFFRWDGIKDDGLLAPIGMYIVHYEFFHPDGDIIQGKKVCVLAQNLN